MQLHPQSPTNRFSILENHNNAYELNVQTSRLRTSSASPSTTTPAQQFIIGIPSNFKPNLLTTRPFHPSDAGAQIYHEDNLPSSNTKIRLCMKEERRLVRDREFVRCIAWVEIGELPTRGKGKSTGRGDEMRVMVRRDEGQGRPGWRDMVRCLKAGSEDGVVEVSGEDGWEEVLEWGYDGWCEICGRVDCGYMGR